MKQNKKSTWTPYIKTQQKSYRQSNPEKTALWSKNNHLKQHYGIDLDTYDTILDIQDNVCAICSRPERIIDHRSNKPRALATDHDHKNGQMRGLLCAQCNRSLGGFEDNIELLKSAIAYLELYNQTMEIVKSEGLNATN